MSEGSVHTFIALGKINMYVSPTLHTKMRFVGGIRTKTLRNFHEDVLFYWGWAGC